MIRVCVERDDVSSSHLLYSTLEHLTLGQT